MARQTGACEAWAQAQAQAQARGRAKGADLMGQAMGWAKLSM